jgi:hypothetical protein
VSTLRDLATQPLIEPKHFQLGRAAGRLDGTPSEVARTTADPQLKSIAEVLLAIAMQRSGSSPDEAGE